jgi:hypothetical protein
MRFGVYKPAENVRRTPVLSTKALGVLPSSDNGLFRPFKSGKKIR